MASRTPTLPEHDNDLHGENRIASNYEQGFNAGLSEKERGRAGVFATSDNAEEARQRLRDSEKNPASRPDKNNDSDIQSREDQADGYVDNFTGNSENKGGFKQFMLRGTKKKGATVVITGILLGLLGFGGLGSLPFGVLSAFENLNFDLDDATPSLDKRTSFFDKKKFSFSKSDAGTIGCKSSLIPIKCKFNTMSKKMVERYKAAGIDVTGETGGVYGDRVKVTKACFGGDCWEEGGAFFKAVNERGARFKAGSLYNAHKRATNPRFLGINGDSFVNKTLKRFGVTRTPPTLKGTPQERVNQLLTRAGTGNINDIRFAEAKDSNGNTIMDPKDPSKPLYIQDGVGGPVSLITDANGNQVYIHDGDPSKLAQVFTEGEKISIEGTVKRVKVASHSITSKSLKAINILGGLDIACSAINTLGSASVAAKVSYLGQLINFAFPYATMAFALKNGTLSPEDAEALGETFFATDNRKTIQGYNYVDDGNGESTEITNPNYGQNALDSELFKMSINGGIAYPSLEEKNYSLGFGMDSTLSGVLSVARVAKKVVNTVDIGGLNACSIASNGAVRLAGIVVGGVAAFFSGGASLAVNAAITITLGVVVYFGEQKLNAALANDLINEDIVESTVGRGAAIWTGMAGVHSIAAQSRGMIPGNADQIVAYQMERNEYKQDYIAFERQESKFFDVTNPYSVTGTFAATLQQYLPSSLSESTISSLPTGLFSFVLGGIASMAQPYAANAATLDPDRYKQCDDVGYQDVHIDADVQCNVRFYMPDNVLEMDPIDVAQWMEGNNPDGTDNPDMPMYVEKDTTTGLPKGYTMIDPSKNDSLAKQIIMGQVNSVVNTRKYGDTEDRYSDAYGKFLDFCVYRTLPFGETYDDNQHALGAAGGEWQNGSKCMETEGDDAEMLNYFRAYTFDKSLNDDLDESPIVDANISCGPASSSGSTGTSTKMSQNQLKEKMTFYGLPEPTADGPGGYNELLDQLKSSPNASWAAQQLLNGEKKWKATGSPIEEYLTTAWVWLETGPWPDPYEMNCNDAEQGTKVSDYCGGGLIQVAGFQGFDRKNDYVEVFKKLYSEDQLGSVLKAVIDNSSKTIDGWSYINPDQKAIISKYVNVDDLSSVTLADISPNKDILDPKTQILTFILGKDPAMAAALNSFEVKEGDVITMLQDCTKLGWSNTTYYCSADLREKVANIMMALYMYDGSGPSGTADCSSTTGTGSALPGWTITKDPDHLMNYRKPGTISEPAVLFKHAMLDNGSHSFEVTQLHGPGNSQFAIDNLAAIYSGYDFPAYGFSEVGHPGYDIGMPMGTKLYSPVNGTVVTSGASGYFYNTPEERYTSGTGELKILLSNGDEIIMGHMKTIAVKVGDTVTPGMYVGESGYVAGPHLHLEYRKKSSSCTSGYCIVDPTENIP